MKLHIITLIISFIGLNNFQQENEPPKENEVDFRKMAIVDRRNNSFHMGSRAELGKAFGRVRVVREDAEIYDEGYVDVYKYNGLKVSYYKKNCDGIKINGKQYRLFINGIAYDVGDNITKLKANFPLSYKHRSESFVRLWIKHSDAYIIFNYNAKGVIVSIEEEVDNS